MIPLFLHYSDVGALTATKQNTDMQQECLLQTSSREFMIGKRIFIIVNTFCCCTLFKFYNSVLVA